MSTAMDARFETLIETMNAKFESLTMLIVSVKESLEREIQNLSKRVDRMEIRLKRIEAGAHYVTRLVEWSAKQDDITNEIVARVEKLESTVEELKKDRQ